MGRIFSFHRTLLVASISVMDKVNIESCRANLHEIEAPAHKFLVGLANTKLSSHRNFECTNGLKRSLARNSLYVI